MDSTSENMPLYFHGWPGSAAELGLGPLGTGLRPHDRNDLLSPERPVDVVAFSLGAFEALQLAARQPRTVRNLTLISPAGPLELGDFLPDMAGGSVFKLARDKPRAFAALTRAQALAVRFAPKRVLKAMFADAAASERALLDDPDTCGRLAEGLRETFAAKRSTYEACVRSYVKPWAEKLPDVQCSVTLIHGDADTWTPPAMVEALADALPRKPETIRLRDRGHYGTLQTYLNDAV